MKILTLFLKWIWQTLGTVFICPKRISRLKKSAWKRILPVYLTIVNKGRHDLCWVRTCQSEFSKLVQVESLYQGKNFTKYGKVYGRMLLEEVSIKYFIENNFFF